MSRRPRSANEPNKPLALFATVLVVVGVAGVVYVSSQTQRMSDPAGSSATSTAKPVPADSRKLLLVNPNGVTVQQLDGLSERLTFEQFKTRFADAALPKFGASAVNGMPVQFYLPEDASSPAPTGLSPDGRYLAHLGTPQSDGAAVIAVTEGKEVPRKIVLRQNQRPLTDAFLYGWFDAKTLIVVAQSAGARWIFGVGVDGAIKPLAPVPENVVLFQGFPGGLWYVTATQGEGLESPPKAPSSLHRVTLEGEDVEVLGNQPHVIMSALPGPEGTVAYLTDDAEARWFRMGIGDAAVGLGKVRPLLFLPDGSLIVRNGFNLELVDLKKGTSGGRVIGSVPEGAVSVFYLEEPLDRAE